MTHRVPGNKTITGELIRANQERAVPVNSMQNNEKESEPETGPLKVMMDEWEEREFG